MTVSRAVSFGTRLFQLRWLMPVPVILAIAVVVWRAPIPSSPATAWIQGIGILLALAGEGLRFYTLGWVPEGTSGQGYALEAKRLNTCGPYAHVRNPLYLGNLGIVMGLVLVTHNGWAVVLALAFFFCQYFFIIRAEESFLRQSYGARYDEYASKVSRWVPRLRPAYPGALREAFDVRRALKKEHNPFTAWSSAMVLLLAWDLYRTGRLWAGPLALLISIEIGVLGFFASVKGYKRGWWLTAALLFVASSPRAEQAENQPLDVREPPFSFSDFSWLNGSNRQPESLLKIGPVTGSLYVDAYYNWQFQNPVDHTAFPSTSAPRHNEISINLASLGMEVTGLDGPIGRLFIEYGSNNDALQGQDASTARGFYLTQRAFAPIREAAAGWHFHWLHGLNLEAGIFLSYVGLESHLPQENWNYSHAFLSDFTPYYLSGIRAQVFPSAHVKLELWIVNGWQTFGQWHEGRAGGYLWNWRPSGIFSLTNSFYVGQEQPADAGAVRYYSDNTLQLRYYAGAAGRPIKGASLSLVADLGYERRTVAPSGWMGGASLAHRIELDERWASTVRADIFYDQTQALVVPLPLGSPYSLPGAGSFLGGGVTATLDFLPNPWAIFRLEYSHRNASVPYFSGRRGITGPGGLRAEDPSAFTPDLRQSDDRVIGNVTLRL